MTHTELAKKIFEISYLKGEFLLRSGKTSNEYFDKYRFESNPILLKEIAKQMKSLIPVGTEVLAGLELGGVPIATALSFETGLPVAFVRKKAKEYGTCQVTEGISVKGKNVCIVEDVITTGGQVVLSARDLESLGAKINAVVSVIYRGNGEAPTIPDFTPKVLALFTMEQLKNS